MAADTRRLPLHAALATGLRDQGVTVVFGLTGSGNLFIADSFASEFGGTFVRAAHEAGAVQMAQGYAKVAERLGVVTVSMGPGVTNTLTGLVECVRGRTPLLVLATDAPVEEKFHWQAVDQQRLVEATGAGFEPVRSGRTSMRDLAWAAQRAVVESRPVVLNVPRNLLHETVDYDFRPLAYPLRQLTRPAPEAIEQAVSAIAAARRPLILAGRGAIQARDRLVELGERIGAPLATTLKAKGLFAGSPLDIGIFGTLSTERASEVISKADCVIAFGTSLNYRTTVGGELLGGKRVLQFDLDPYAIGATRPVDVGVHADCTHAAAELLALWDTAGLKTSGFGATIDVVTAPSKKRVNACKMDATSVVVFLNEAIPAGSLVVTDGGNFALAAWKYLDVRDPRRFLTTLDFGAIGSGMGNAIGGAYGSPDVPTVLITGDGGFALGGLTEFNTAVRHGLDLITVVCNNGSYGPEYLELVGQDRAPHLSMFDWPDFASVAVALGGAGISVRSPADFARAAEAIAHRDRPLLIDVILDPADDRAAMRVSPI